jgi:hypothetical protein
VQSRERELRDREEPVRHREGGSADQPRNRVLDLQQSSGNRAIARLLQRKDGPASTDVADTAGGKHGAKAPEKKVEDIHARVIKYDIDDGKTLITIASGLDQGVKVGMSGSLLTPSGKELADFTIEHSEGRVSKAHVEAIPDQVRANSDVIIKASSFHDVNEGKEF